MTIANEVRRVGRANNDQWGGADAIYSHRLEAVEEGSDMFEGVQKMLARSCQL